MRRISTFLLCLMFGSSALASISPNLYDCKGDGLRIVYSTSSIIGQKTLSIDLTPRSSGLPHAGKSMQTHGEGIRAQATVLGELITAYESAIPDYVTNYVGLIIPLIQLDSSGSKMDFTTYFTRTMKATSLRGRDALVGVLDRSEAILVECEASLVQF